MLSARSLILVAIVGGLVAGCGDPFTPSMESVAGEYAATVFTTTTSGTTTDQLAAGASFMLTLTADGTVAGRLFVPDAAEGGGDFDADMTGTWAISGDAVTFDQATDTFVRDMPFIALEAQLLQGEATFTETTIRVVLSK